MVELNKASEEEVRLLRNVLLPVQLPTSQQPSTASLVQFCCHFLSLLLGFSFGFDFSFGFSFIFRLEKEEEEVEGVYSVHVRDVAQS